MNGIEQYQETIVVEARDAPPSRFSPELVRFLREKGLLKTITIHAQADDEDLGRYVRQALHDIATTLGLLFPPAPPLTNALTQLNLAEEARLFHLDPFYLLRLGSRTGRGRIIRRLDEPSYAYHYSQLHQLGKMESDPDDINVGVVLFCESGSYIFLVLPLPVC